MANRFQAAGPGVDACIAKALNACIPGVLSSDELDKEIDGLMSTDPTKPRAFYGTDGESWHQACIPKALSKKYGTGFKWERLPVSSIYKKRIGRLYVHGLLNYRYFGVQNIGDWRHAMCVNTDNGTIIEQNYGSKPQKFSANFDRKTPLENLFSEVWQVYRLQISRLHVLANESCKTTRLRMPDAWVFSVLADLRKCLDVNK